MSDAEKKIVSSKRHIPYIYTRSVAIEDLVMYEAREIAQDIDYEMRRINFKPEPESEYMITVEVRVEPNPILVKKDDDSEGN